MTIGWKGDDVRPSYLERFWFSVEVSWLRREPEARAVHGAASAETPAGNSDDGRPATSAESIGSRPARVAADTTATSYSDTGPPNEPGPVTRKSVR